MDAVFLSRLQFAVTIGFHYLFPPLSIGLAWLLVVIEGLGWCRGGDWSRLGHFFGKLFALTFAVGVASGIVMEFQFGTNWAKYSEYVGDIFGAPLAAEGVFSFFLESSFLGLYLFGRKRLSPGVHWCSILMVAVGATLSAFWIIVANSWMQTPDGFAIQNGRAELLSFTDAVFNASTMPRFCHTIVGALITGAFFMGGISAWFVLRNRERAIFAGSLKISVVLGFVASISALFPTGHLHAGQVARTQPEKFAAIEGLYDATDGTSMVLFALPFTDPPRLKAKIAVPGLLGLFTSGDPDTKLPTLKDFPADETPRGAELWIVFVAFHNMVILGMLFIGLMSLGIFLIWKRREQDTHYRLTRWWLKSMMLATPLPLVANELGWIVAEVGRQPWIVYKVLRTDEAASVSVTAGEVLFSLVLFGAIYLLLGGLWIFLVLREIKHGPASAEHLREVH